MCDKEYPILQVIQIPNGKWKWLIGLQNGNEPVYASTASFKTAKYAKQNAEIVLSGRNIPYIMGDN